MTVGKQDKAEAFFAGRLSSPMSKLLLEWNEQPRLEWEVKNLDTVLRVDRAHAVMLTEENIITRQQGAAILQELERLRQDGADAFSPVLGYGSIVLQIEKVLAARLGEDTAGRLPTARSRLDQGPTVQRISDRENVLDVMAKLLTLHETLLRAAEKHADVSMLGYTHLQQAQPANFGHYLLAFRDRLQDSFQQLTEVYSRINRSSLGAVGLSGTDVPINRHRTASLLGFSDILDNSRLGHDLYYQIEIASCLAYIMTILNDVCTDLHVFSSTEFGTVELDDSHCSTSSIFPQKKNPYALETVKGKAGEAHGWVAAALATFRNEGTCDTAARIVRPLPEAYRTTTAMIKLTAEVLEKLTVNKGRYEDLLQKAWVTTSRFGNLLVSSYGLSYRAAHGVVARLVKNCIHSNVARADVTVAMLQDAAKEMGSGPIAISQDQLRRALDHGDFIRTSNSFGGVGLDQVKRLLTLGRKQYVDNIFWLEDKTRHLNQADGDLRKATQSLIRAEATDPQASNHT